MKKKVKTLCIIIGIILSCVLIFFVVNYYRIKNMPTISAVVVKVNETRLDVMRSDNTNDLIRVYYEEEGNNKFEIGQEILIYFDGIIALSFPGQLHNVEKVEIIKEESDTQIPEDVLRVFYSSRNNVTVSVSKLTKTGLSLIIKDTNKLKYNYNSNEYKIKKEIRQAGEITIDESKIIPATENSTEAYIPDTTIDLWKEVPKISDESLVISLQNVDKDTFEINCDWTNIYGELGERKI